MSATFNTRISLKYDTYAAWTAANPKLLKGEIAVVVVPAETGAVASEPAILFKVGDGTSLFNALPFASGLAGDVYSWAKASSKPTYSASEIDGLSTYISGQIQDTDTQYKIEVDQANARKFYLYSKAKDGEWGTTPVSTVTIPAETVYTLVEGSTNGTVKFNGTDVAVHGLGSAAYKAETDFDAAGAADAVKGDTSDENTAITVYGARKLAQKGVDDAAAAKTAADAAQDDVDALSELVGTLPSGSSASTVVGYVDEKIAAIPEGIDYTVTVTTPSATGVAKRYNIKQAVTGLDVNIDIPKDMVVSSGTVETKETSGAWGEAGTYLHLVLANADNSDVWIDVGNLIEYVTSGSQAGDQIMVAISSDHKVTATLSNGSVTLAQLHADVQTAIGKAHTHANSAELDKIASGDKAKWDAAEAKAHEHANKTVLDGITSEKVTSWDGKADGDHEHDIADLNQASGYVVFDCGSSTINIA